MLKKILNKFKNINNKNVNSHEKYLNESTDIYDLEFRMKQLERNNKGSLNSSHRMTYK